MNDSDKNKNKTVNTESKIKLLNTEINILREIRDNTKCIIQNYNVVKKKH